MYNYLMGEPLDFLIVLYGNSKNNYQEAKNCNLSIAIFKIPWYNIIVKKYAHKVSS